MTDKEILNAIRVIFIEKMKIHPRFKGLNAKLLWKEIEPRISIQQLRQQMEQLNMIKEPAVEPIAVRAFRDVFGPDYFSKLLQETRQLSKEDAVTIGELLSKSVSQALESSSPVSASIRMGDHRSRRIVSEYLRAVASNSIDLA